MARGKDTAQTPVYSFAIVKFHLPGKDVQFDVAPLKWIQKAGNKTTIYWPSDEDASTSKALLNLISKEAIVNKESWMLYNISVVAKFDTYAGAKKKLASAIDGEVVVSTDLENRGKGGRNKAKKRNADAVTASSTSPDPSTSSQKRTRKDAGNEKEKSCQSEEESDVSSNGGHGDCEKLSSSDDGNTSPVSRSQTVATLPVSTGPNKRSVNEKVAKKSTADKQLQLPSVPIGLGQKQVRSELPHRQPITISIPPATAGPSRNVPEIRGTNLSRELIPRVFATKSAAPDYGSDGMDNDRTNTTHNDTSSMQVHQRLTTISTFAPGDFKKIDFLIEQNKRILRGQEQIKAQNLDIKNTLAVVMDNTIPVDQEVEGIKQEFRIPIRDLKGFDTLNLVLKQDKVKRMKLKAYLIGLGGSQSRVVGNVLTKLMTFSIGALFCLKGQNVTKRCFDKTEVMDLVLASSQPVVCDV